MTPSLNISFILQIEIWVLLHSNKVCFGVVSAQTLRFSFFIWCIPIYYSLDCSWLYYSEDWNSNLGASITNLNVWNLIILLFFCKLLVRCKKFSIFWGVIAPIFLELRTGMAQEEHTQRYSNIRGGDGGSNGGRGSGSSRSWKKKLKNKLRFFRKQNSESYNIKV